MSRCCNSTIAAWKSEAKTVNHKKAAKLSTDLKIERGAAPAAGFESPRKGNYMAQIAAAGQEAQFMLGLVRELGTSLNLQETLSTTARRLSAVVSFQGLAVYECRDELLLPVYVEGQDSQLFSVAANSSGRRNFRMGGQA